MDINDIKKQIPADKLEEAKEELAGCKSAEDLLRLAGKYDIELSDEELETVSGGNGCYGFGFGSSVDAKSDEHNAYACCGIGIGFADDCG